MKRFINVSNSCSEKWENMKDSPEGRFCEICSKCVIDFTDKTDEQIQDIFTNANSKEICGRISSKSLSMIAAGIVLITNLTLVQAQISNSNTQTEQIATEITKLSGRLIFKETQKAISDAEVLFITKSKLIKTTSNENGYFSLEIPDDLIEDKNVLYFNFDKINEIKRIEKKERDTIYGYGYANQTIIFSKKEKVENKKFQIDYSYKGYEIGAVVIISNPPPDYYYFDGKSIN